MITYVVVFTPIGQASRLNQIVQRLSDAITTGLLEPGEQLPNETDPAKMTGVSHITIREVLNTLRANSFVHTVYGRNGGNFVCENIDGKNSALYPFKAISMNYLSNLGEMHCVIISHSAWLASQWVTDADITKFREFAEVLRKANLPELMIQAGIRCLLTIAASSYSARLTNWELQVQAERASLVTILYRTDSIHTEIIALYSTLADALAAHNEAESIQFATQIIDTFTYYLIEKKLKYNSN